MMKLLVLLACVLFAAVPKTYAVDSVMFSDLPCGDFDCLDGFVVDTDEIKERFLDLAHEYVSHHILTTLKARTLAEFFFSMLQHGPSGMSTKCLKTSDMTRAANVLSALAPPPHSSARVTATARRDSMQFVERAKNYARDVISAYAPAVLRSGAAVSREECMTMLRPQESNCRLATCLTLTGKTQTNSKDTITRYYWTCCQSYYSTYYGWYCGLT
mmetsp:Transcript_11142/g.23932  ORF Transcript_11142/g.23932 Transcript_11142/m.23932 type:complete len:215 (+) Transcript_11142:1000-1644(+)